MTNKIIIFDMDGVIADSRMPAKEEMVDTLVNLSSRYILSVISGGNLSLFKYQFLNKFIEKTNNEIHLLPTCGTQYYIAIMKEIKEIYNEELPMKTKEKIIKEVSNLIKKEKIIPITYDQIEDRGSQVTFSALGRSAPLEEKVKFDPNGIKRLKWKKYLSKRLSNIEIAIGGTTSMDFNRKGISKAYGVKNLIEKLNINKEKALFFGDKLFEGGNDYSIKKMGIKCVEVKDPQDTYNHLKKLLI